MFYPDVPAGGAAQNWPWLPSDNNLLIANYDPAAMSTNGAQGVNGTLYFLKLVPRVSVTVSNLWFDVGGAGSGASTGTFAGIYSSSGALLTQTADLGALFNSTGPKQCPLTASQLLSAGSFYWACILWNLATSTPFLPMGWGGNGVLNNLGLTAATAQFASGLTLQTSLPASVTPSGFTLPGAAWWVGGS